MKENLKQFFIHGKTLPRWLVLALDMIIIGWSFTFSYFIVKGANEEVMDSRVFLLYVVILCFTALPVVMGMRLHTGLMRYSNSLDMLRIFVSVLLFSLIFLTLAFLVFQPVLPFQPNIMLSMLLISFFVTVSMLILLRIVAKSLFYALLRRYENMDIKRVLIFGSDRNALLVKQALENSEGTNYVVVGFVDTNRKRLNSYMEQKKVYHFKELQKLNLRKTIDKLVIVNENLDMRDKRVVIERSLRLGIKVLTVPPIGSWLSGKLDKKQVKNLRIEDLLQRKPIQIDQTKVKQDLHGKRVLVTGAAGSIGSEIVRQVLSYDPVSLILCDNAESALHDIQLEIEERFAQASVEIVIADVRNRKRMDKLFRVCRPEVVFHAAAYKHVPLMENNPVEAVCTNVEGTKYVADLSIEYGVEKFVMVSTDKAVNPTNVMGATKRLAEIYIQSLNASPVNQRTMGINGSAVHHPNTRFITTRFGNVLGSNGSVVPHFRAQIEKGGPLTVTHPEITRYFMTIGEAVQLVLEAGTMGKGGEIYVFDMGKPVKISDMAKKMIQLAGLVEGKDIEIVYIGLRPGEKLYEELLADAEVTLPTYHEKIRIAKVKHFDYNEVNTSIQELFELCAMQDKKAVVSKMKAIVPEFISENSIFKELDIKYLE